MADGSRRPILASNPVRGATNSGLAGDGFTNPLNGAGYGEHLDGGFRRAAGTLFGSCYGFYRHIWILTEARRIATTGFVIPT